MNLFNSFKKFSIVALVMTLVITTFPNKVDAGAASPSIEVKNDLGEVYIPTDLCNFIQTAGFGCNSGDNSAYVFNDKTIAKFKNSTDSRLFGLDIVEEKGSYVVNFVNYLDPQIECEERGIFIKKDKLSFKDLKSKASEDLGNIEFTNRYSEYFYYWGTDLETFKKNGTDYIFDIYIALAYNSNSDKYSISFFVPEGSNAIKYINKKEDYIYQNIKLDKKAESYDANTLGYENAKKLKVNSKLSLNAKANGKITYTKIGGSLWYDCPASNKLYKKNYTKNFGTPSNDVVSKNGVISIKKNYSSDVMIKASAKGKYATTYRFVKILSDKF